MNSLSISIKGENDKKKFNATLVDTLGGFSHFGGGNIRSLVFVGVEVSVPVQSRARRRGRDRRFRSPPSKSR